VIVHARAVVGRERVTGANKRNGEANACCDPSHDAHYAIRIPLEKFGAIAESVGKCGGRRFARMGQLARHPHRKRDSRRLSPFFSPRKLARSPRRSRWRDACKPAEQRHLATAREILMHYTLFVIAVAAFALAACTSSYHPEYHPVTVSNFSQNLSYPVEVKNGGAPSERSPVYVVPSPPVPPPNFFAQ
jgi:hypothetical protein